MLVIAKKKKTKNTTTPGFVDDAKLFSKVEKKKKKKPPGCVDDAKLFSKVTVTIYIPTGPV